MEPIKMDVAISVSIDLSENSKTFISSLFKSIATSASAEPAAPAKAHEPAPVKVETPVAKAPVVETPAAAAAKPITIEDVRKELSDKVNDHRAEIKEKLNSLGAPSVTKLDPDKYAEMYNFLKSL